MKKVIGIDLFVSELNTREDFFRELNEKKENTSFIEIPFESLAFTTTCKAIKKYGSELAEIMGVNEELIEDTKTNTDLIAVDLRTKKPYLVGDSVWLSLINQYKINGNGFKALDINTKVTCLNELSDTFLKGRDALLIIIDNKIRAIMTSGEDGRTYTFLEPVSLFESFEEVMKDKDIKFEYIYGGYNYEIIHAIYEAHDKEVGYLYEEAGYIPEVFIETSETGYSSTKLIPCLKHTKSGTRIRLEKEAILLEHKGSNTAEKLRGKLPLLFVRQQKFLEKIDEFMEINIKYPYEVMNKISKSIGFSMKNTKKLKECFADYITISGITSVNMYDIFQVFIGLDVSFSDKTEYEKMLGNIITLDIPKVIRDIEADKKDDVMF